MFSALENNVCICFSLHYGFISDQVSSTKQRGKLSAAIVHIDKNPSKMKRFLLLIKIKKQLK